MRGRWWPDEGSYCRPFKKLEWNPGQLPEGPEPWSRDRQYGNAAGLTEAEVPERIFFSAISGPQEEHGWRHQWAGAQSSWWGSRMEHLYSRNVQYFLCFWDMFQFIKYSLCCILLHGIEAWGKDLYRITQTRHTQTMGNVLSANRNLHIICMFARTQMRSGRGDMMSFVVFMYFFLLYLWDNLNMTRDWNVTLLKVFVASERLVLRAHLFSL